MNLEGQLRSLLNQLSQDSSVATFAQNLLYTKPIFVNFRPDIENAFLAKRTLEFSLIFRIASFLWLTLYLVILSGSYYHFPEIFKDKAYIIWQSAFLSAGIVIFASCICCFITKTHAFIHQYIVAPAITLLLYQLLVGSVAHADNESGLYASYNIIIAMIIALNSLRIVWQKGLFILVCSGLMAYATAFVNNWHIPLLPALHSFVLIGVVLTNITFFIERRERFAFLNEILVEIKSHELSRINRHLITIAREDALSGLANRRAFDDTLIIEWDRARREEQPLSLLFMDVDHFKLYNDTYGHGAGDDCLRQVASAIKKAVLRPADLAARYGGEEFVVLLPATDALGAEEVAERILRTVDSLAIPHKRSLVSYHVTVSIGICTMLPSDKNSIAIFVENADAALYKAKTSGRHCLKHYIEPPMLNNFYFKH
ncbi:MAG TPA: diguanylate cyclase [Agitococcus sp.]|nr:diguanylate cyclase [Agitococcus sp.]HMV60734.1 diguanylate cyclase [Agitococcus sp.]HMX99574.1 diguanylate cyclase [Agitococcus sp.]HMY27830.1 diguanylate cyclase [Agitococcus sp.]HMY81769.1 diguanylate cyclase [Agitococcus sp.]